jgi:biotin carboxylase
MPASRLRRKTRPEARGVPHLLLVGPRPEVLGKLLGLPVAVTVVRQPGDGRHWEQHVALRIVDADYTDAGALLAAARQIHEHRRLDAVLAMTELALQPAASVSAALGVRGNSPAAVSYAMDKARMRDRLAAAGLDSTAYRRCADLGQAREFARSRPSGVVLKPVNGTAGTGVRLAVGPAELAPAWEWASTPHGPWSVPEANGRMGVLAEEFLTGREFSVEAMSADGRHHVLAVTAKHTTGPPHFVEIGHDMPAPLSEEDRETVARAAVDALTAIGYEWGPSHTEVMLSGTGSHRSGATVVEINARVGGGQIWELVGLTTGLDVFVGSVRTLAYGELPEHRGGGAGAAAIRFLAAAPGRVSDVDGVDKAQAVGGVLRVGLLPTPGHRVGPLVDGWGRSGYVLAVGPDSASAATAAELAASLISIRTVADR